jgi:hypothetical protein
MIDEDLDYSNKTVQDEIQKLLDTIENSRYFRDDLYTQSWLRAFLARVQEINDLNASNQSQSIDVSNPADFMDHLQKVRVIQDKMSSFFLTHTVLRE